jgi:hypothetical protein
LPEPTWGANGIATLWSADKLRLRLWQFAALLSVVLGIQALFVVPIVLSVSEGNWTFALIAALPMAFFLFFLSRIVGRAMRATNAELAPGKLRLGFRLRRNLAGWRILDEIRFVAVDPSPEAVAEGRELLHQTAASTRLKKHWQSQLDVWACMGGLLVFTEDEMLFKNARGTVARTLEQHWRAFVGGSAPGTRRAKEATVP